MKTVILALSCLLCLNAKEIQIPDACSGSVCIENVLWKKGVAEHTLLGTIRTKTPIESMQLKLDFEDGQKSGSLLLNLRSISTVQQFFFKVDAGGLFGGGLKWERSHVHLTATAIHNVFPMERSGLVCSLDSQGSRLGLEIVNSSGKDVILDYSRLTLTSETQSYKLNSAEGRYSEVDKPRPNALIPSGTAHWNELTPIGAVKFIHGEWQEFWLIHQLLLSQDVTLFVPFVIDGRTTVEKVPLQVTSTTVELEGTVSNARRVGQNRRSTRLSACNRATVWGGVAVLNRDLEDREDSGVGAIFSGLQLGQEARLQPRRGVVSAAACRSAPEFCVPTGDTCFVTWKI
jgi:hypothetical protein